MWQQTVFCSIHRWKYPYYYVNFATNTIDFTFFQHVVEAFSYKNRIFVAQNNYSGMIWSFEGFFPFIIEFASAFYFAICIILLFLDVPKTEEYLPYRKAKHPILSWAAISWRGWYSPREGQVRGMKVSTSMSSCLTFSFSIWVCFALLVPSVIWSIHGTSRQHARNGMLPFSRVPCSWCSCRSISMPMTLALILQP